MAILNGLDLGNLVTLNNFDVKIDAEIQKSHAGGVIVFERERKYGSIDLTGGIDWGWLTHLQLKTLQSFASVMGATYSLDYESVLYNVRFRTEDIPVIFGDPLIQRPNVSNTDYYNNIFIKLMEV